MRYAYRLKGEAALVTSDYSAKAPATSSLYQHIRWVAYEKARAAGDSPLWGSLTSKQVKEIAARDYELITYVLVEEAEFDSLQDSSDQLQALENAGVDNWEWYGEAMAEYHRQKDERAGQA